MKVRLGRFWRGIPSIYTENSKVAGSFKIPEGLTNPVNLGKLLNFSGSHYPNLQLGITITTSQVVGRRDLIHVIQLSSLITQKPLNKKTLLVFVLILLLLCFSGPKINLQWICQP